LGGEEKAAATVENKKDKHQNLDKSAAARMIQLGFENKKIKSFEI